MSDDIDLENAILYADSSRGVYIPQFFAESIKWECVSGVSQWQLVELEYGPDYEFYWDTWDSVESNATVTDPSTGQRYSLWQDGDLWLVPIPN